MATTAVLNLGLNFRQFNNGIKKSEKRLLGFQKTSVGVGTVVGALLTGVVAKMSWSMIKLASDAEEVSSKFTAVFKGIEKESDIVAKSLAQNFGIATSTSKELLSSTGDLLTGFGFTTGEALKLSSEVNKLAIDLASFQNHSGGAKGASEALTKALLGETESAKSLGIVIRQGTKEFKSEVAQIKKLTGVTEQQAKTQVIWKQIVEQSKNAVGDYAKTAGSTANRIKEMGQRWKELQEDIGRFLIDGLKVDKMLGLISKSMKELADNAHTVKMVFKSLQVDAGTGIAKAWIKTKGVLQDSINGYKIMWTKATGSKGEYKRLVNNIKYEGKVRKAMLESIDKLQDKQRDKISKEWVKEENAKKKVTVKDAEQAIKDAIKKTEGSVVKVKEEEEKEEEKKKKEGDGIVTQRAVEGAFLKGTLEANKLEKTQFMGKIQNKQLKEAQKANTYLNTIASNQTSTEVADF